MKQGDNTRQHIIDVANELFYHQGYSNTSFANIVDKTGLSKGNITYHFKNKKTILEEIVNKRLTDIDDLLHEWNEEIGHPVSRLMRFCEMLVSEQDDIKSYGCPMGTLTGEFSKNDPELYSIALPMFQRFRGWLKQQYRLLNCTPKQADEKAFELLSRVQGIAVVTHAFKDKAFLNREIGKLKDFIRYEYGGASC